MVDYLKLDVITDVEKVTPVNVIFPVIFPAITVCNENHYSIAHYINGAWLGSKMELSMSAPIIRHFISGSSLNDMYSPYPVKKVILVNAKG